MKLVEAAEQRAADARHVETLVNWPSSEFRPKIEESPEVELAAALRYWLEEAARLNLLEEKVRFILPVLEGLESGNYGGFTLEEVARSIRIILDSHSRERVKDAEALADQQP